MNILKTAWDWLVWSSANKDKISLTLRAGIPAATVVLLWFHVAQPDAEAILGDGVTAITNLVAGLYVLLESVRAVYGLARKIYYTIHPA